MLTKLHYDAVLYQPFTNTSASYKCLNENNNFMIDDIDQWLESASGTIYTNIAPISLTTDIAIKLPINEVESVNTSKPTYMKIITRDYNNQIINKFYYFIRGVKRFANATLEYQAHIDVLNTFHDAIKNGLTSRTLVQREHRDRFKKRRSASGILSCYKVIDDISEGLKPLKFVNTKNKIQTNISGLNDTNWYLIYKTASELTTSDAANPVSCFCCSDKELSLATTAPASLTVSYTDLTAGTYYYFGYPDAWSFDSGLNHLDNTLYPKNFIIFYRSGDTISDELWGADGENWTLRSTRTNRTNLVFTTLPKCTFSTTYCDQLAIWQNYPISGFAAGDTYKIMKYDDTDNTDSKLVKIIQLPYAPVTMSYSAGLYSYDTTKWSWYNQLLKLNDIHNSFSNSEFNTISMPVLEDIDLTNTTRHIIDPKLLHSDFHTEKFSYDNFGLEFNLEEMEYDNTVITTTILTPVYNIDFYPTNTINSNFMFDIKVKDSADADGITYRTPQDYNVLVASRNNEVTVFNNAYINYLKTGYNYDKKAKAISSTSGWIGTAVGIGSTAAGIALSATGAGAGVGAALVVSGLATTISSLTSAISNDLSEENALQSKLTSLKAQATAVSGCDDIDLLNRYNGNKLWYITYNPNDQIQNMLDNLFYYYGYTTSYIKKPDLDSRTRFNFLQCTPDFTQDTYKLIGDFSIEVINKCKEGFTNIHHYESVWDTLQVYENYETSLYGTAPTPPPETYTLTLHYYKDGSEDVSLRDTKLITKGTEVSPADYVIDIAGYTYQDSVPNDSFIMSADNSIQLNYVKNAPVSYTLTLHYYKDGVEDTSLRSTKTIATGTEVFPSDYQSSLTGYTFQSSVPNDSFNMNDDNSIQYNYITTQPITYTLTLHYYKDGSEDVSLRDTKAINKGTEVSPVDYQKELSGFTYQDSVPNDSFVMNNNNSIQYNYITTQPITYTLTLHYYKDGTEDVSLRDTKTINSGTEVSPVDYQKELSGFTYQDSVPNDSFNMNDNNSIQYNYITTPPTSYTLTLHYYKDGVEDVSLRDTKTIVKGTEVSPYDYKKVLSGFTYQDSVPSDSFVMNDDNSIQYNYVTTPPTSYTLTLHYYKDGSEDVSLRETRSIVKGTEVYPVDYKKVLSGYTYQDSVPNDSFVMNNNYSIQYNYITTPTESFILTLHYYKDGTEDVYLRDEKLIAKGTEVFPVDYQKELSGFTYQYSVPNDSFYMNYDNSIQYNYTKK